MSRRLAAPFLAASLAVAIPLSAHAELDDVVEDARLLSLTGSLVDRTSEQVTVADGAGNAHTFRVNEQTRYVYGERSNPKDLRPGARVRAEYVTWSNQRVALALWVLEAPRS